MESYQRMTLEMISKEIGISRTTIYKIVNHKGKVSSDTTEKVEAALRKYNYTPNQNARSLAINQSYNIAFIGFDSPDADYFLPMTKEGIKRAIRHFGDHGLIVDTYFSNTKRPELQVEYITKAYRSGVRHFVIAPADDDLIKPMINFLLKNGCSVILYSLDLEEYPKLPYIGIDYLKSGQLAGEIINSICENGRDICILTTTQLKKNKDTQARLRGFNDISAQHPKNHVLPININIQPTGKAIEKFLHELLEKESNLGAIYDLTFKPDVIAKVLKQMGKDHSVKVVSFDLSESVRPYIQDGTIDVVIFQNLADQAYFACKALFEEMYYRKSIPSQKNYDKLEIIVSGNLEYYS